MLEICPLGYLLSLGSGSGTFTFLYLLTSSTFSGIRFDCHNHAIPVFAGEGGILALISVLSVSHES
jgi:hypothetical protein